MGELAGGGSVGVTVSNRLAYVVALGRSSQPASFNYNVVCGAVPGFAQSTTFSTPNLIPLPPAPTLPTVPAPYDGGVRGAVFRVGHWLDPEPDPSQAGDQVCQVLGWSVHCAV